MGVIDFNCKNTARIMNFSEISGVNHACRQTRILPSNGSPSNARLSPLCSTLPRQPAGQKFSVPRSVSHHGVCATNLSGKPAGYRIVSSSPEEQVISHGHTDGSYTILIK